MPTLSPTAAVARSYARIAAAHSSHLWISLQDESAALNEALDVERELAAGREMPLAGLTFAVKDNIDVAGLRTTAAHPGFDRRAVVSASVVSRLRAAGAVFIGKTNLDQFATGLVGTRSPFGQPSSALAPERVSGGSSSGSAVAVAEGLVDFSLGTDTAGSGRVPAAFNGIIGLKPTYGLVAADGVVPACPSYDCVSVFAPTVALSAAVLRIASAPSERYPHSRVLPDTAPLSAPRDPVVAIPQDRDLTSLPEAFRTAFAGAIAQLVGRGVTVQKIDFSPFAEAGRLLYDGGLVAERAASFGRFLAEHPEGTDPHVGRIAAHAEEIPGVTVIQDQQVLAELTRRGRELLQGVDALVVPTAPEHPLMTDVLADDAGLINTGLGAFTNFVNLMDMAAIAVPVTHTTGDGAFGITFVTRAFHDQVGIDLAADFLREPPALSTTAGIDLAVFGAHLHGQPLNRQLTDLGGRFIDDITTATNHRLYLAEGSPPRPIVAPSASGISVPGELWRLPLTSLARLLTGLPAPMGLGQVSLSDGRTVCGFIGQVQGVERDITSFGGWRAYLDAAGEAAPAPLPVHA
ncbi:allophanate hydrolase [Citricoccus sp.]|uniref:allophanate hydrolase n=1 Tax=Citricoccus sp. TaxID=1978372 RepID=UPI0028BE56AF|nr:allophanate hydrolase [Citricoccus sp.]